MHFVIFEIESQQWRWHLVSHAGTVLGESTERLRSRNEARDSAERFKASLADAAIEDEAGNRL